MNVTTLTRDTSDKLPSAAWPGGYPIVYYTLSGEMLCPDCATESLDTWIDADWRGPISNPTTSTYVNWYDGPQYSDILYEGIEFCTDCGDGIRGAYEPDEDDPTWATDLAKQAANRYDE